MMTEEYSEEEENFDLSNLPPYYAQKLNGFLREASKQGHLTCVEVLVSKGADVNYIDKQDKTTVLQAAILNGHNNITSFLFSKSNEKTRQAAHAFARDQLNKLQDALKIFKDLPDDTDKRDSKSQDEANARDKGKKKVTEDGEAAKEPQVDKEPPPKKEVLYNNPRSETFLELEENHKELKKDYNQLHREYNALETDYDELQTRFNTYKTETDELVSQLKEQVERLNNELAIEKEHNEETEDVLDNLGKELTQKMREITSVKIERDTERRAKEIAKRILSGDNTNITSNGLLLDIPEAPKSINARNRIELSFGSDTLVPNKIKQEGSKDDIEIHIEDRVKYRVRRLVKRWEERTFSPTNL